MTDSKLETGPLAQTARFTKSDLVVDLLDGRTISAPLIWFTRLNKAAPDQLKNYEILADGEGLHWPDLDEDLSVAGLLRGTH